MSNITLTVSSPPRGAGTQSPAIIQAQVAHGSLAWGGSPSSFSLVYTTGQVGTGVTVGALVELQIAGLIFYGRCQSDVEVVSSKGATRELQFVDLRDYLSWDFVKCSFNNPWRRLEGTVWKRYWWHYLPKNFDLGIKTWTDAPYTAAQILGYLLGAPTVGTRWGYDLTGAGQFPGGLMNQPVYGFDCSQGVRLDAALNDLSQRGGLVFCLNPQPTNSFYLTWTRKGYGTVPVGNLGFPVNTDDRRSGFALSGNATNINVLGERNQYMILNIPLVADWNPAWEQFLVSDAFFQDIFNNATDQVSGLAYTAFLNDPEQMQGAFAAKARSLEITVAEYVAMRNARSNDGGQFADYSKFAGRLRMDMPVALYLSELLYRAYAVNVATVTNVNGANIPIVSAGLANAMLCQVTYDPIGGTMSATPSILTDGNGLAIVQGCAFGHDLFQLVQPDKITPAFFSATSPKWTAQPFRIDDSGDGTRFIIFETPIFTSENMLVQVDGYYVPNAQPTFAHAAAQAALTFELEPFSYWRGTYPNVSRDRVEFVSGLHAEYVGTAGRYTEITYANGQTAEQQAYTVASNLLLCQYIYSMGGYRLNWQPQFPLARFATFLSSVIDRVEVTVGPDGAFLMVDFTTERERAHFEPERDLERRTMQNTLFPGQAQLKAEALDNRRFQAGFQSMPRDLQRTFMQFLNGNFEDGMQVTKYTPAGTPPVEGASILAGTPLFKLPTVSDSTTPTNNTLALNPVDITSAMTVVFMGVTVRANEQATGTFYYRSTGTTFAQIKGPVAVNDPIGMDTAGYTWLTKNTTTPVGVALQAVPSGVTQLANVRLGSAGGGGSGQPVWLP